MIPEDFVDEWLNAHQMPSVTDEVKNSADWKHFRQVMVDLLNAYTQHILDIIEKEEEDGTTN